MIRSIVYSRYLKMAMPIASGRVSPMPTATAASKRICPLLVAVAAGMSATSRARLNTAA